MFWQQGYDGTPVQALCRAMDLQPGSVYAAFGSKRDLFVAAMRRYIQTVSAEFAARDPEVAGMFQLHLARLQTSFAAALALSRADGELRQGAGPESAGMLVAVVQGMNVMAKGLPGRQAL